MSSRVFSKYVHKAQKKAKAGKQRDRLRPVIVEGGVLGRTWWGKAWNENLESYTEYGDLPGRGRSVARSGAIVDLQVAPGEINALVQGSRPKPYAITITIHKLNRNTWNQVVSACKGKLDSLDELLAGRFPKAIEETFMQRKTGLFPSPREIEFECSCPDWTSMCKHIAGALYGIGARLDEDPTLFFTLRGVDPVDLLRRAVQGKAEGRPQAKKGSREGAGQKKSPWSPPDDTEVSWEEGARMAEVRRVLKKQVKIDARSLPKRKRSAASGGKNSVKGAAGKALNNQARPGKKK